jgi:hypothetical protein
MNALFTVPFQTRRSYHKGSKSKTHKGDLDFTTKKGNKVYHQKGHYVRKTHRPYSYHKGSKSKTRKGDLDFTTKKGDKVFHRRHHYVRKSRRPYSI